MRGTRSCWSHCFHSESRVLTSLVTQNSMYFPGYFLVKAMKLQANMALNNSVCVDNEDITKM